MTEGDKGDEQDPVHTEEERMLRTIPDLIAELVMRVRAECVEWKATGDGFSIRIGPRRAKKKPKKG